MCGRFTQIHKRDALEAAFLAKLADGLAGELQPRYNVAPTQPVLIVREQPEGRGIALVRWGLVPSWSKELPRYPMFNARSETAATNGAFKNALRRRRCLVPVAGFYEWKRLEPDKPRGKKQPHYIRVAGGGVFGMAGLWEHWQDAAGNELESCTVLTCEPNELMADLHDRMPVIVPPEDYARWLDPANEDPAQVADLLRPFPADRMEAWPVGAEVGSVRNDRPELIAPVAPPGKQAELFGG